MKEIKYILLAAISLDGKIAKNSRHATNWTSPEDKRHIRGILNKCDISIVGNNTYKTSKKPLSKRNCLVFTRKINQIKKVNNKCTYINPQEINIIKYLKNNNYKTVCILGGTQVYNWALKNKMITDLCITIEPLIFSSGFSLFDLPLEKTIKFRCVSSTKLNNCGSLLLKYKI